MYISEEKAKQIYQDAQQKGFDPNKVMSELVRGGAVIQGINMEEARQYAGYKEPIGQRIGGVIQEAGKGVNEAITGTGEYQNASILDRGVGATSKAFGAISGTAIQALPEPIRNAFDKLGEGLSSGVGFIAEKISNNPELQKTVFEYEQKNPGGFENILNTLKTASDLGIISGEILGTEGAARGITKAADITSGAYKNTVKSIKSSIGKPISNRVETISNKLSPKDYESAISSLTDSYKSAFINEKTGVNNKLSKLGRVYGKSPDELIDQVVKSGIAPEIEGSLAKFDRAFDSISNRKSELASSIDDVLKTQYGNITTPLEQLRTSSLEELRTSAKSSGGKVNPAELIKAESELQNIFDSFERTYGKAVTPEQVNQIRKAMNARSKAYKGEIFQEDVSSVVGDITRKYLDDTIPDEAVRNVNAEIGKLSEIERTLKIFDNQKIDVGVLGTQVGRLGGALALGAASAPISGPGALVIAGAAAMYGGNFVADFLRGRKFSKAAQNVIKQQLKENPDILKELIDTATTDSNKKLLQRLLPAKGETSFKEPVIELPPKGNVPLGLGDEPSFKSPSVGKTDLLQEAKKYKTAEEFVKAQGETLYHGSPNSDVIRELKSSTGAEGYFGNGVYLTRDKNVANSFTKRESMSPNLEPIGNGDFQDINTGEIKKGGKPGIVEATLPKNIKLKKITIDEMDALIEKYRQPNGVIDLKGARNAIRDSFAKQGYDGFEVTATKYFDEPQTVIFPQSEAKIKTKSQLTDIWKEANKGSKVNPLVAKQATSISDDLAKLKPQTDDLLAEARKYKSAEEFVKAQGTPVYHGGNKVLSPKDFRDAIKSSYADERGALFTSSDKQVSEMFGKQSTELYPKLKNPLIIDAKKNNYYEIPIPKELRKDFHSSMKTTDTDSLVEIAQERGHDGVIIKNVIEGAGEYDPADARNVIIGLKKDSFITKSQLTDIWNKAQGGTDDIITEARKYKSAEVKKLGLNPDNIEYHGTGKSFDKFTLGEEGSSGAGTENLGVFTTKSKEAANFWAEKSAGVGKNGKVMEVYLDVKNPKIFKSQQALDDFIGDNPEQAIDKLKKQGFDAIKYPESGIDKFPFDYWDELASKGVSFKNKLPDEPYMTTQVFNPKDVYIINNGDLKSVAKKIKTNNMNFFDKYPDITGYKPEEISLLTTDKYIRKVLEHYSYHNKTTPAETVKIIREQLSTKSQLEEIWKEANSK